MSTVLVVPDLHGHLARLETALGVFQRLRDAQLVFLGDLTGDSPRRRNARGDFRPAGAADEAQVILRRVRELVSTGQAQLVLGNHEVMAIAGVLEDHRELFEVWWTHGGRETAASYGWRGTGDAGTFGEDLDWLREHGRLWLSAGPAGAQTLLAHATRPSPERVASGKNRYSDLLKVASDAVVWFPLGLPDDPGTQRLPPLPGGFIRSLHGHMETQRVTSWPDAAGLEAHQLDLHPRLKKLALAELSPNGGLKWHIKRV